MSIQPTMKLSDAQRGAMQELMILDDIHDIKINTEKDDYSFLSSILSGCGWKPYNQLSDEEFTKEFLEREFFGEESLYCAGTDIITDNVVIGSIEKATQNNILPYKIPLCDYFK